MGAIEGFIRAIVDFFRKLSSVYKDLYEATSDFSEMTDMIIKLCNDFGKAKTREEKEEIAKQVINTFASLKNTILSLNLTPQEQKSFKEIEELVKKLNKSSVNVTDFATNFMRIVGAQTTNKAFELSSGLQDKSDIAEKRTLFTEKILEDIKDKIKNPNKALIIATKYVGNGQESKIDTADISKNTGIAEDKIKEIMNGGCYNEISLINKKQQSETSNSKAEYDAMEYIINNPKLVKKKVEKYKSILEEFSQKYQSQIRVCLQKIMDQKTIHEEFGVKYNANAIQDVVRDIVAKMSLLDNINKKIKNDFKYKDEETDRCNQINKEKEKIEKLEQRLKQWEMTDQDKKNNDEEEETKFVDKNDKAEELSKIRGLINDLDNAVEMKFKGYDAIADVITDMKEKINSTLDNIQPTTFQVQDVEQKTLNERYDQITKEKVDSGIKFLKEYTNLRQASTSNRGRH